MRYLLKATLLSITLLCTSLYAGGKGVVPVDVPVQPIPEDISPWYLGAGLTWALFHACDGDCTYEDATYGVMIRGGYDVNSYLGLEARYMHTFLAEGPEGGSPLQHVGLYAKPQYPLSENVNIYGLLGYGYTKNLGKGFRLNYFNDDHGFSGGLGFEYDLSDKDGDFDDKANYDRVFDGHADQGKGWSLFADYQRLLIKSGVPDMDVVSVGLRYDF